eukprot:1841180-Prymnesium_polylepis.1
MALAASGCPPRRPDLTMSLRARADSEEAGQVSERGRGAVERLRHAAPSIAGGSGLAWRCSARSAPFTLCPPPKQDQVKSQDAFFDY